MSDDHYFTAQPASAAERRLVRVSLAGHDVEVETAGGIFSPGRIDLGTQVLLRTVPAPPHTGNLLDLGCGWGPLALTLAIESPDAHVWAVDVNERALDLVARNARRLGLDNVTAGTPEAVPADIDFAAIWSNPPIRVGKEALHAMMRQWLAHLAVDASAHLVVQRHLGADTLHRWLEDQLPEILDGRDATVERVASAKGFRVLEVRAG